MTCEVYRVEEDEANRWVMIGVAAAECLTDEALAHLKTYKYSSVDKSPISKYIMKHYVSNRHIRETDIDG